MQKRHANLPRSGFIRKSVTDLSTQRHGNEIEREKGYGKKRERSIYVPTIRGRWITKLQAQQQHKHLHSLLRHPMHMYISIKSRNNNNSIIVIMHRVITNLRTKQVWLDWCFIATSTLCLCNRGMCFFCHCCSALSDLCRQLCCPFDQSILMGVFV